MDLVLLGGNVLTMNDSAPRAEAVGVVKGKITVVGATAQVSKMVGPDTQIVHLAGRTLIPGFVDPHNHFSLTIAPQTMHPPKPNHLFGNWRL